jgi:hypothetical protein
VGSKLFDPFEYPLDIAGILTQKSALEHEGVPLAGTVANFSVATDTLICVNANQGTCERRSSDHGDTQIGDSQFRRPGALIHILDGAGDLLFDRSTDRPCEAQSRKARTGTFEQRTPGTSRLLLPILSIVLHSLSP